MEDQGLSREEAEIPFFKVKNLQTPNELIETDNYISTETAARLGATVFPPKTLVFAKVGAALLLNRFRVLGCEGCIDNNMMALQLNRGHCVAYVRYALDSVDLSANFNQGPVPSVNTRQVGAVEIPLPPLPEQERIAAYLNASCAAIDAAVAAKRRQIEVLDGLRESTTHRAVTIGLDSNVKLRDSGVEWFDRIPAHWEVERLKDVVAAKKDAIKVGPFGSDLLLGDMTDEGIKVFNQRTVIDRDFASGIHFVSTEKYAAMKAFTVYSRDLLITTRGTIGRCAVVPDDVPLGILHPCLMRIQTDMRRLLPEYLAVLIQDCGLVLRQLQMMSAATTIDVIYSNSLKRTYLPLPPVSEQESILAFLGEKTAEFSMLKQQIESQIATLLAYRKSLIHECVTGGRRVSAADVAQAEAGRPRIPHE